MRRVSKALVNAAKHARLARHSKETTTEVISAPVPPLPENETYWSGGVNHFNYREDAWIADDSDCESTYSCTSSVSESGNNRSDSDLESLDDNELLEGFERLAIYREHIQSLNMNLTKAEWKSAESGSTHHIRSSYTGHSIRTANEHAQKLRKRATEDEKSRKSFVFAMFAFFINNLTHH
jgi:hypothetical protein